MWTTSDDTQTQAENINAEQSLWSEMKMNMIIQARDMNEQQIDVRHDWKPIVRSSLMVRFRRWRDSRLEHATGSSW